MKNTETARRFCPYPTIRKTGELVAGTLVDHPKQCRKCQARSCHKVLNPVGYVEGVSHFVCERGISIFDVAGPDYRLLINGVLDSNQNSDCPPPTKKSLRGHKLRQAEVENWMRQLNLSLEFLQSEVDARVKQVVSGLHDVQTSVNLVFRNAEALVEKNPGESFAEKADSASPELKDLLNSVALLTTRFVASSIVTNLESVSYGKKRWCPVYKLFHKFVRLFEETANKKNVGLYMDGVSRCRVQVYDSMEALALVLVDNAVKYTTPGHAARVIVNDEPDGIYIVVESEGPVVPEADEERIFEKGYRTARAMKMVRNGSGLGLYIASKIAESHGASIRYRTRSVGGNGIGTNVFSLKLYSAEQAQNSQSV